MCASFLYRAAAVLAAAALLVSPRFSALAKDFTAGAITMHRSALVLADAGSAGCGGPVAYGTPPPPAVLGTKGEQFEGGNLMPYYTITATSIEGQVSFRSKTGAEALETAAELTKS